MVKVNVFLPKKMHEALRRVAELQGVTMADIVRGGVKDRLISAAADLQTEQEALHTLAGDKAGDSSPSDGPREGSGANDDEPSPTGN